MKAPLRLGYVCFSSYGGSGVVATELARGMAARGHDVHLIAGSAPRRLARNGAPVTFHALRAADYPLFEQPLYGMAIASKIVEVVETRGLDLLHVHYAVPHATCAYLARQILGARAPKIVTTLHGTDVTRVGVEPSVRAINRFSILASDGVTAPSSFLRDAAREALDLQDCAIEVLENFVDTKAFAPVEARDRRIFGGAPDEPVLIHVSNFRAVKRVEQTVEVLARVRKTRPARLVLVGEGPERGAVEARIEALGLRDDVVLLGARDDVAELLANADVFLLPSETESFGLAALEAASCGVPVIASNVGGLPEVVEDGVTGILTPSGDVDAMADATAALLGDPDRLRALGADARRRVEERFGRAPALDRYERYYRRIFEEEGS